MGYLVPESLKDRWSLRRGVSKRVLPKLLPAVGKVEIFIHDSLVTPHLARPSMVIADDVQGNGAFLGWVRAARPDWRTAFGEEGKDAVAGVAVFI